MKIFLIGVWVMGTTAMAQQGRRAPQPPVPKDNFFERVRLASEIPNPIDRYTYRITGTWNGTEYHPAKVPLWDIDQRRIRVGDIAVGETVTLDYVFNVGGRNFFGFKREITRSGLKAEAIVFVDGRFIEAIR